MKRLRLFTLLTAAIVLQCQVAAAAPLSISSHQLVPGTTGIMHIYLPDPPARGRDSRFGTYYTFLYSSTADRVHFDHCVRLVVIAQSDPAKYVVDLTAVPAPASRFIAGSVYATGDPYREGFYGGGCRLINRPI